MKKRKKHNQDVPLGQSAPEEAPVADLSIATIPDDFYGGKNPEIYSTPKKKEVPKKPKKEPLPPPPVEDTESDMVLPPKKKKTGVILLILLFFLVGTGATLYYLDDAGIITLFPAAETPAPVVQDLTPVTPVVPVTPPQPVVPTTTPSSTIDTPTSTIDVPTSTLGIFSIFPAMNSAAPLDLDDDALSDAAEAAFLTDPGMADTDGDGYPDGVEVRNLYNPRGLAPVRIIDSDMVREYLNPVHQYRLYYPNNWALSAVDAEADQVLISDIRGDYISITASPRERGETFPAWFLRTVDGQKFLDLTESQNLFAFDVYMRTDGLVAYVVDTDAVYVLMLFSEDIYPMQYKEIFNMVVQSFRPQKTDVEIPDQIFLPGILPTSTLPDNATTTTSTTLSFSGL